MPSIYTVTLNPALDKTVQVPNFAVDQVNRITWLRRDAGGKGINVSKVIAKLGGESTAIAVLAGQTGKWIADTLGENNIKVQAISVPGETRTNLKFVDTEGGTNTDINEPGPEVTDTVLDQALADVIAKTSAGDIVVLSGSLPRGASADTYGRWTRALRDAGLKVYLDADGAALSAGLEQKPYFTKPNNHELSAMLGRELTDVDAIAAAASEIVAGGIDTVCVSMGGNGAVYADWPWPRAPQTSWRAELRRRSARLWIRLSRKCSSRACVNVRGASARRPRVHGCAGHGLVAGARGFSPGALV